MKNLPIIISLCAILYGAPVLAQSADAPTHETVIATVNGQEIKLGHLSALISRLPAQYGEVPISELYQGVLDQLVEQELLREFGPDESPLIQYSSENEMRTARAMIAIDQIGDQAVTDSDVQSAYDRFVEAFERATEYNAAHILVETEEEAKDLLKALDEGADFATLAQEKSTGPSGPNGGDLGWFQEGAMVDPFNDAILSMAKGDVAGPIETQFGWHVIILRDIRETEPTPFEDMKDQLRGELSSKAIEAKITELKEKANIEIDEATFDLNLLRDSRFLE